MRGQTFHVIVMDEAAFMDESLFKDFIAPVLAVANTVVLGISTPGKSEGNFYNGLTNAKNEDGASLFKTLSIVLVCEKCRRKGIVTDCHHNEHLLPPWKDAKKQKKLQLMMQGDENSYVRENLGLITTDTVHFFPVDLVNRLMAHKWVSNTEPDLVTIAIDPSGGGGASDFAIASVFSTRRKVDDPTIQYVVSFFVCVCICTIFIRLQYRVRMQ